MKKNKNCVSSESYDDILSDALDESDKGTKANHRYDLVSSSLFSSRWGQLLLVLLAINVAWLFASEQVSSSRLDRKQADDQLRTKYGAEAEIFSAVDELAPPEIRSVRQLGPAVDRLNNALDDGDDSSEPAFRRDQFFFFGDTLVYTDSGPEELPTDSVID